MTTTDSNTWGGNSGHTYTFTRRPDGTTDLDAVVVREGKNLKGRALGLVLAIFGKRVLGKELERQSRPSKPGMTARARRNPPRRRSSTPMTTTPQVRFRTVGGVRIVSAR